MSFHLLVRSGGKVRWAVIFFIIVACTVAAAASPVPPLLEGSAEAVADGNVTVSPLTATNANGVSQTVTFSLPATVTCTSDDDADDSPETNGDGVRDCAAADVNLSSGGVLVSGPMVSGLEISQTANVTVVVNGVDGTFTVSLNVTGNIEDGEDANAFDFTSQVSTMTYVHAELRHMSDVSNGVIARQGVINNVRRSRHVVCTVQGNTAIDLNNNGDYADAGDIAPAPIAIPLGTIAQLEISSGGGHTSTADPDPTFTDVQVFMGTGANGGLSGSTCLSWVSAEAGDQELTILYTGDNGSDHRVNWDSDNDNNDNDGDLNDGPGNRSLIADWNGLEDSTVVVTGDVDVTKTYTTPFKLLLNLARAFNPANDAAEFGEIHVSDIFNGSHVDRAGSRSGPLALAGVEWTVTKAGCGVLTGALSGTTFLNEQGAVSGGPVLSFASGEGAFACTSASGATITIAGTEPSLLGSAPGVTVTQVIRIVPGATKDAAPN